MLKIGLAIIMFLLSQPLEAKLRVVTTTTTLASLVNSIGSDRVKVNSVARGHQDPHYVEAKPSYFVMLSKADLFVLVGLDLEVGWAENVIRGSRNPNVRPGAKGYLETGQLIQPIQAPQGRIDRSLGDIHPQGNPHYYLDPLRTLEVCKGIRDRLILLDPKGKQHYDKNFIDFSRVLSEAMTTWKNRVALTGVSKVVSYHKTLQYFLDRFGVELAATIEAKPGIPPSSKHVLEVRKEMLAGNIVCILHESFFEKNVVKKLTENTAIRIQEVATEVMALDSVKNYFQLIDNLVTALAQCALSTSEEKQK